MLTFPETLDALERVREQLKSVAELEAAVEAVAEDLAEYVTLLRYSHEKQFESAEEALSYIDSVLIPQMRGIRDTLGTGTDESLKKLKAAHEQMDRLVLRMQMVINGDVDGLLP
jgi:DNA anti-recombination protein RmuC